MLLRTRRDALVVCCNRAVLADKTLRIDPVREEHLRDASNYLRRRRLPPLSVLTRCGSCITGTPRTGRQSRNVRLPSDAELHADVKRTPGLRLSPQVQGERHRVDLDGPPPSSLVAPAVKFTMVEPAERNREFVADPATECAGLSDAQILRGSQGARPHTTQGCLETNLRCSLSRNRIPLWDDRTAPTVFSRPPMTCLAPSGFRQVRPVCRLDFLRLHQEPDWAPRLAELITASSLKRALDCSRVGLHQRVFRTQVTMRPHCRIVCRADALDLGDQLVAQLGRLLLFEMRIGSGGRRLSAPCWDLGWPNGLTIAVWPSSAHTEILTRLRRGAPRSGASMSSSPAIPTRVNSA